MPHKIVGVGPAADPIPLLPGEQVIFSVHPSLVPLFALLVIVLGVGVAITVFFLQIDPAVFLGFPQYSAIINVTPAVAAGLVAMIIFLNWLNTIYVLTDRRVQWEFGILGEKHRSIDNRDIQAVETNRTFLGQIFNFGDIRIRSAQQPIPVDFIQIGRPVERANQIIAQQP